MTTGNFRLRLLPGHVWEVGREGKGGRATNGGRRRVTRKGDR